MNSKKIVLIGLFLVLILSFVLRLNPFFVGTLVDPDSYFHLRQSEKILETHSLVEFDDLSLQGRIFSYPVLFHIFFATLAEFSGLGLGFLISFMPAVYGTFSVLLVFVFVRRIFGERIALLSAFSLSILLLHVLRTVSTRPDGLGLFIAPGIIFLIYLKHYKLAGLLVIPQMLFHPLSTAVLLFFLIVLCIVFWFKKVDFNFRAVVGIIFTGLIVWLAWLFWLTLKGLSLDSYFSTVSFESVEAAKLTFLHIASYFSFNWIFFLVALVFFGWLFRRNLFFVVWLLSTFFVSIFALRLAIFFTVPGAILSGIGLSWVFANAGKYSKFFVLFLIVLLVVTVQPFIFGYDIDPNISEQMAMVWLKENSLPSESIFAQWDQGHYLTYFAQRKVVMDGYFEFAHELKERNSAIDELASTTNCQKIRTNVEKFSGNYFFVEARVLKSRAFLNGILDAKNCKGVSAVYASEGAKIIEYEFA
ncbi:MAG: hypothetical protein Q7K42_03765 [Candidatus Diapherotrites archaeon]|nr:hypothetical protein [Candidatus Diapherotrites archaeon]